MKNKSSVSQPLQALLSQGLAFHQQNQLGQALQIYEQILSRDPKHFDALHFSGVIAHEYQNHEVAIELISQALAIHPDASEAYANRGNAWMALGKYEHALADYDQAIRLNSKSAIAWLNRGTVLQRLGRFEESVQSYDQTIVLRPQLPQAFSNRGNALLKCQQLPAAIDSFDQAIRLNPQYAQAYWNKAQAWLTAGNYLEGWPLYEYGWLNGARGAKRQLTWPYWVGEENLSGRSILVRCEQGLGDTLQLIRYARVLKDRGATTVFEIPRALLSLFKQINAVDQWICEGDPLPVCDFYCSMFSLPLALKTTLQTIPFSSGYLRVDTDKSDYWHRRLGAKTRMRVGLVWSGGLRPHQPELWDINQRRNVSLAEMAQAFHTLELDFYSLQKGEPAESEIKEMQDCWWPEGNFFNFADELHDFSDTAALIDQLDVVVTVDTATAHLAAALGKPTWILNRFDTCWRWLLDRNDSPWYDSVKLYRQGPDRQWGSVLAQVALDLETSGRRLG